ncbi:MAG: PEGA domain-containing protein [Vicinamibacterales bacterium]
MRLLLAAALALLPLAADAQSRRSTPSTPPPAATLPPIGLPLAPIGLPLADVTPTLAPLGLPAGPTPTTTVPDAAPRRGQRQRGPSRRGGWMGAGIVYVVPGYAIGQPAMATPGPSTRPAPAEDAVPPAPATLWIEAEPRGVAEIFVDGDFVGTADGRTPVTLEPGRHRVELRAAGHESQSVDVRADAGASLTLRRTLQALDAPAVPAAASQPPPAPAPIPRKPFYFIPGCYLGDVPPKDAGLPASCDLSRTVVMRP